MMHNGPAHASHLQSFASVTDHDLYDPISGRPLIDHDFSDAIGSGIVNRSLTCWSTIPAFDEMERLRGLVVAYIRGAWPATWCDQTAQVPHAECKHITARTGDL
jgi:hypothetical protein